MAGMKGVGTFSLVIGPHGDIRETVREIRDIQSYINKIKKEIGELYDLWDKLAPIIISSTKERFNIGGELGDLWLHLAKYTKKKRKAEGTWNEGGQNILVESGRLRDSIDIMRKTPSSLKIGTNVPYAWGMQDGIRPNPDPLLRPVPARPFLYFSRADRDVIDQEIQRFINDLISKGASESLSVPF